MPVDEEVAKVEKKPTESDATIKAADQEPKALLKAWELAYRKEIFYNGLPALLEISREGVTKRQPIARIGRWLGVFTSR